MFHFRIHCSSQIRLIYIAYEVCAFDFGRFCTHTLRNPLQRYRNTTNYANSENMLFNILFQRLFVWKILHKIHNSLRIIINHFSKLFHTKMYYKREFVNLCSNKKTNKSAAMLSHSSRLYKRWLFCLQSNTQNAVRFSVANNHHLPVANHFLHTHGRHIDIGVFYCHHLLDVN